MRLAKKAAAGAQFVQTQCIFNVPKFEKWMEMVRDLGVHEKIYILAGITPCKSIGMARYMKTSVPGMDVPDELIDRLKGVPKEKVAEEGIKIAVETIEQGAPDQRCCRCPHHGHRVGRESPRDGEGSGTISETTSQLIPICLHVYTFVVAASLSSTYPQVRLRRLLAAASVSNVNANWYNYWLIGFRSPLSSALVEGILICTVEVFRSVYQY